MALRRGPEPAQSRAIACRPPLPGPVHRRQSPVDRPAFEVESSFRKGAASAASPPAEQIFLVPHPCDSFLSQGWVATNLCILFRCPHLSPGQQLKDPPAPQEIGR